MKINRFLTIAASLTMSISMLAAPMAQAYAEGYPFRTTCNYYYDQFSHSAQKLYDDLYSVARIIDESSDNYAKSAQVYYQGIDSDELHDLMIMFAYEHPEFFWISNRYSYGYVGTRNYVQLEVFAPYQDGAARQKAKQEILAVEQSYIDGAMQYSTDYERAKYLSVQLRADVTYGSVAQSLDQSLASTFLYKKTVCAGFTKAYTLLANAVGVDTVYLRSATHAWNATKIADVWYVDDVTNKLFLYSDAQVDSWDKRSGPETVTYSDGTVKQTMMHEKDYYYFTDIFPDTSKEYNGKSKVLSGTVDPRTDPGTDPGTDPDTPPANDEGFIVDSNTCYYFADDQELFDPADLASSVSVAFSPYGNETLTTEIDLSSLDLAVGWESPEQLLKLHASDKPYYHGPVPVFVEDEVIWIGDVWIIRRGDMTMDGLVNAKDAASILISAASVGTGSGPRSPEGTDHAAAIFAGNYVEDSAPYPNATDASGVLLYAARAGAGVG